MAVTQTIIRTSHCHGIT